MSITFNSIKRNDFCSKLKKYYQLKKKKVPGKIDFYKKDKLLLRVMLYLFICYLILIAEEDLKRLANLNYPGPTQTRKVEGVNLPFFQINMTDGTVCDLSGRPRHTNVLYVCYPQSKHNLFSVKETSTCQYEVIVLTSLLCSHPWYKLVAYSKFMFKTLNIIRIIVKYLIIYKI